MKAIKGTNPKPAEKNKKTKGICLNKIHSAE